MTDNASTEAKIDHVMARGVDEVIVHEHLRERLEGAKKLRVKLGIDPTARDLHLGHAVVLRKLRQFQDLGHKAILIIGDYTALIGDPSGRNELRPVLTKEQIEDNMSNYLANAGKIIDVPNAEVRHNSEWYKDKGMDFFFDLTSKFTVARSLERDDFQKRMKDDRDVSVLEILYPLLQGYDSVEIKADVELGGTDQKFNLLTGRKVQRRYELPEQDIMTMKLIEGTDGVKKMSKSAGNYIGLTGKPADMFGKIMSIPDDLMVKYFETLTDIADSEIKQLQKDHKNLAEASRSPKEWKEKLAHEVVSVYHGAKAADKAQEEFTKVFSGGEVPSEVLVVESGMPLDQTLVVAGVVESKTEVRRLVEQKGIKVDGETVTDSKQKVKKGSVIKIGPRRFLKTK